MREELIRVENGCFRREDEFYRFEISISRGECIGVYVDDHFTSGTAYLDLFKGGTHLERGRAFSCGRRVGPLELERWILQNARIVNWHRFHSQELTVRDFLLALDRPAGWPQRWGAVRRLHSPESQEIRQRMELRVPLRAGLPTSPCWIITASVYFGCGSGGESCWSWTGSQKSCGGGMWKN